MPVEIEAKMKVDDHAAIRQKLAAAGALLVGDFLETNVIFDTRDGTLRAADQGLRLRVNRNVSSGSEECQITFKGPRRRSALKSRDEIETLVADFSTMAELLQRLGFGKVLSFEKRRQSWKLLGCKVELDELPRLGTFVEVEGPSEGAVQTVRSQLGLSEYSALMTSYISMLMANLQESEEPSREIVFPET